MASGWIADMTARVGPIAAGRFVFLADRRSVLCATTRSAISITCRFVSITAIGWALTAPTYAQIPPAGPPPSITVLPAAADTAKTKPAAPVPGAPADSAKAKPAPTLAAYRFVPPILGRQDSLFIAAATGEPRFQAVRDSCQRILVSENGVTLDYLIARRLTDQTPRQRHYVEALFKVISDSGRNPFPVASLGTALPVAPDSVKAQLLHIGSELGDSAFLKVARIYLESDSVEVRKNAVRSLGSYPSPANAATLLAGLEKTSDLELAERLWALGRQKDFKAWAKVLPYLKDSNLYNRELARRIVSVSCGDWANVEKLEPAGMDDAELLEWILMADESPGLSAKIWVRKHVPRLSPARMKFIGSALRLQ